MSTVTIPRELAQSLLVLMTRDATEANVPAGQWRTFANALDRAMIASECGEVAPTASQDAPGATQAITPDPSPTHPRCRFCKETSVSDGGLCTSCTDDLLRDAQELEASRHVCPRCDRA